MFNRISQIHRSCVVCAAAVIVTVSAAGAVAQRPLVMRHIAMNTEIEFVMFGAPGAEQEVLREAAREAFAAIDALEARVSRFRQDSFVTQVNRQAAERPVVVPTDIIQLLQGSRQYSERTDGAFDVTIGPIMKLWGFYAGTGEHPSPAELEAVVSRVGMEHVTVDEAARTVFFEKPDMHIDFGGVAKGLALDRAAAILREHGVESARLNIGTSTIVAIGAPPGRSGWTVDIRSPYNNGQETHVATVDIRDESLSTSSRTERYLEIDGDKYGHIVDPRTGIPATGVLSATAIAPDGFGSDALSTAFYVMGLDATQRYCESYPDARAILVVETDGAPETIFINMNQDSKKEQS